MRKKNQRASFLLPSHFTLPHRQRLLAREPVAACPIIAVDGRPRCAEAVPRTLAARGIEGTYLHAACDVVAAGVVVRLAAVA